LNHHSLSSAPKGQDTALTEASELKQTTLDISNENPPSLSAGGAWRADGDSVGTSGTHPSSEDDVVAEVISLSDDHFRAGLRLLKAGIEASTHGDPATKGAIRTRQRPVGGATIETNQSCSARGVAGNQPRRHPGIALGAILPSPSLTRLRSKPACEAWRAVSL
jgi:hypothetical protein